MHKINIFILLAFVSLTCSLSFAQMSAPRPPAPSSSAPSQMGYASYGVSPLLDELQTFSQNTVGHIDRIRVDKWKTDSRSKTQAQSNAESLQRNMSGALPTLIQQVRSNPASLAATVKLYRNLNALYDVMMSYTEAAGAFGSKDDYNLISNDVAILENIRRNYADQLEKMASAQDDQIARLALQVKAQQAAEASAPPKKIVVDDNAPSKKTTSPKKKPAAKPAAKSE